MLYSQDLSSNLSDETLKIDPQMMKIYQKPYKLLTTQEKDLCYQTFKNLSFFHKLLIENEYGELIFRTIIKRMTIKILKPGEVIFRVREPISSMIFLLEGKIIVYKPPPQYNSNGKKTLNFYKKLINSLKNVISSEINKVFDRFIEKGEQYGLEDIKKEKREVLTETKTFCVIGELSISDYILIFEKTKFLEKNDMIAFIGKMKMFKSVSNSDALRNIYHIINKRNCKKGEILCKRGDPFTNLYLIKSGSFQISFKSNITIFNDFDLTSFDDKNTINRFPSCISKYEIKDSYNDFYEYKIINCGRREIIGDIEYAYSSNKYYFDVKCEVDNSLLLEIPINKFEQIALHKLKKCLIESGQEQIKYYNKRINEIREINKKREDKKNKYKILISQKINKNKGKIIQEIEKKEKEALLNLPNTKNIEFVKKPKNLIFTEDNMNHIPIVNFNLSVEPTNYSSVPTETNFNSSSKGKHRTLNSFYSIKKHNHNSSINTNNSSSISNLNYKSPNFKNQMLSRLNNSLFLNIEINSKIMQDQKEKEEKKKDIKKSLIYESNKNNYSNCFETSKDFFLKNNTSILSKNINKIFMNMDGKK